MTDTLKYPRCQSLHPVRIEKQCDRPAGHADNHHTSDGAGAYSWIVWRNESAPTLGGAVSDLGRLRVAIKTAARWFREYEEIHKNKFHDSEDWGAVAKAERNRERAEYLEGVLIHESGQQVEGCRVQDETDGGEK